MIIPTHTFNWGISRKISMEIPEVENSPTVEATSKSHHTVIPYPRDI